MGKILLIEPQKILRQAISLSLFPDYEVKVGDDIASNVGSFKEYDLLIVDAAALRESRDLTPEAVRAIQGCKTPTLWLEEEATSQTLKRDKLIVLKKPIEKESFHSALTGLLSSGDLSGERTNSFVPSTAEGRVAKGELKKRRARASEQPALQFIDLVDVVEEQSPPKQGKKAPRKSK